MITFRRWEQAALMDPLNPYQRIRIVPAYGTSEGAHGAFFWNPVSTEGIRQLAAAESQTQIALTWPAFAGVGVAAGVVLGGLWAWRTGRKG